MVDPDHGLDAPDRSFDAPGTHRPSREAWRALHMIDKHEAVCAERYRAIANTLESMSADQKVNRYVMFALIITVLGALVTSLLAGGIDVTDDLRGDVFGRDNPVAGERAPAASHPSSTPPPLGDPSP